MEWRVTFPVVGARIDNHALHRGRAIIPVLNPLAGVVFRHGNPTAIWIEQNLGAVKAAARLRIEWPTHAITVKLSRLQSGNKDVPVMIGTVREWIQRYHACRRGVVFPVEEEKIHPCGIA